MRSRKFVRGVLMATISMALLLAPSMALPNTDHAVRKPFEVSNLGGTCDAQAGILVPLTTAPCTDGTPVSLLSSWSGQVIPAGFQALFILTTGPEQTIIAGQFSPTFNVSVVGMYTMHGLVFDNTLDLGSIQFGVSVLADIDLQLIQGGGTICGSLDMVGDSFNVTTCGPPCDALAGTLTADEVQVCLVAGEATVSGTPDGNAVVPEGSVIVFGLSQGVDQVIVAGAEDPSFVVNAIGTYTIHPLVYDSLTFDLSMVVFGETMVSDLNDLFTQGGGTVCASIDVVGAAVLVENCLPGCLANAGSLLPEAASGCLMGDTVTISASVDVLPVVPAGSETAYVLTSGVGQVIDSIAGTPTFLITVAGSYTIHTLVYDPATLDLNTIELGVTTAAELVAQLAQGGGTICGSLDVAGATILVVDCCLADAGTLTADIDSVCYAGGPTILMASANGDAVIPVGFEVLYLLTTGEDQVITAAGFTTTFEVGAVGVYTIHTLVYDPNTLDLGQFNFGESTADDVNAVLVQGGGAICASFDMAGATISVVYCCSASAGTLTAENASICLPNGPVFISATANGDAVVPTDFETVYVLTSSAALVIEATSATPSFAVFSTGDYTIHSLVYDPTTLDLGSIQLGVTTASEINALLVQGGGAICASLDLVGANTVVLDCAPANDACVDAWEIPIAVVEECATNMVAGDNTYATPGSDEAPTCGSSTLGIADVWYVFNSGSNTSVSLVLEPGSISNWALTVTDGCTDGTELICELSPAGPIEVTTEPNTAYLIRVFSDLDLGQGGTFELCLTGAIPTFVCDGGMVTASNGATSLLVCQDGEPDVINMYTTSTSTETYMFIATNEEGTIVAPVAGNSLDFNALPVGVYQVWGISYNGGLVGIAPGNDLLDISSTGECLELSAGYLTVTVDICSGVDDRSAVVWGLFPNPTHGVFNVSHGGPRTSVTIEVLDANGRLVKQERAVFGNGQQHVVALDAGIGAGVYTVRLMTGGVVTNLRMLVY
ncbi:MAG: T9SS type A sorting domain-containing protein [Flavobacteriales bacterium]|nr:T9SS type A sorting domain-containing protein [Flavobacteriales bacterium]